MADYAIAADAATPPHASHAIIADAFRFSLC